MRGANPCSYSSIKKFLTVEASGYQIILKRTCPGTTRRHSRRPWGSVKPSWVVARWPNYNRRLCGSGWQTALVARAALGGLCCGLARVDRKITLGAPPGCVGRGARWTLLAGGAPRRHEAVLALFVYQYLVFLPASMTLRCGGQTDHVSLTHRHAARSCWSWPRRPGRGTMAA